MPSRTATAYPPTSGAGIARAAAGGHERLPETANPITECDKAPEPRRARTADMVGRPPLVQPPHLCAELGDLRVAGAWSGRLGPPPCRYECCLARMQSPE